VEKRVVGAIMRWGGSVNRQREKSRRDRLSIAGWRGN
jgi:hypothetical protein